MFEELNQLNHIFLYDEMTVELFYEYWLTITMVANYLRNEMLISHVKIVVFERELKVV